MDRRTIFLIGWAVSFFLMDLSPIYSGEDTAFPQRVAQGRGISRDYIIAIQGNFDGDQGVVALDPRDLRVGRRDNVTWINESNAEVKMKFGKGTDCKEVSVKSLGWNLDPERCFETKDSLRPRGSTTIRFKDTGLYTYQIEYVGKNRKQHGIIHVQTEDR